MFELHHPSKLRQNKIGQKWVDQQFITITFGFFFIAFPFFCICYTFPIAFLKYQKLTLFLSAFCDAYGCYALRFTESCTFVQTSSNFRKLLIQSLWTFWKQPVG